jgi:3-phenylpropionate/trans-cinnamate dioxygenase ferredoxin reductase subunit
MLARAAKLELGDTGGVSCSSRLETSADGVFAAGDMCEYDSPLHGRAVRIEHWDVGREHGRTAALNMLGRDVEHAAVPYFWSDLADWTGFEYVSGGDAYGGPVVRGSLEDAAFTAFWLAEDGRLASALVVGRPGELDEARRMIAERKVPRAEALADEGLELRSL